MMTDAQRAAAVRLALKLGRAADRARTTKAASARRERNELARQAADIGWSRERIRTAMEPSR